MNAAPSTTPELPAFLVKYRPPYLAATCWSLVRARTEAGAKRELARKLDVEVGAIEVAEIRRLPDGGTAS